MPGHIVVICSNLIILHRFEDDTCLALTACDLDYWLVISLGYVWRNTLCLKKRPTFTTRYNFYIHSSIATIFGTNVAEKVGNQNVLYFPTTPN